MSTISTIVDNMVSFMKDHKQVECARCAATVGFQNKFSGTLYCVGHDSRGCLNEVLNANLTLGSSSLPVRVGQLELAPAPAAAAIPAQGSRSSFTMPPLPAAAAAAAPTQGPSFTVQPSPAASDVSRSSSSPKEASVVAAPNQNPVKPIVTVTVTPEQAIPEKISDFSMQVQDEDQVDKDVNERPKAKANPLASGSSSSLKQKLDKLAKETLEDNKKKLIQAEEIEKKTNEKKIEMDIPLLLEAQKQKKHSSVSSGEKKKSKLSKSSDRDCNEMKWQNMHYSPSLKTGAQVHLSFEWNAMEFQITADEDFEQLEIFQAGLMNMISEKKLIKADEVKKDDVVIAEYDGGFYRGRVVCVGPEKCRVVFIDYGDQSQVDLRDVFQMNDEMFRTPIYGLKVRLDGIECRDSFLEKKLGRELQAKVTEAFILELSPSGVADMKADYTLATLRDAEGSTLNEMVKKFLRKKYGN